MVAWKVDHWASKWVDCLVVRKAVHSVENLALTMAALMVAHWVEYLVGRLVVELAGNLAVQMVGPLEHQKVGNWVSCWVALKADWMVEYLVGLMEFQLAARTVGLMAVRLADNLVHPMVDKKVDLSAGLRVAS